MWFIFELAILGLVLIFALWLGQMLLMLVFVVIAFIWEILKAVFEAIKGE